MIPVVRDPVWSRFFCHSEKKSDELGQTTGCKLYIFEWFAIINPGFQNRSTSDSKIRLRSYENLEFDWFGPKFKTRNSNTHFTEMIFYNPGFVSENNLKLHSLHSLERGKTIPKIQNLQNNLRGDTGTRRGDTGTHGCSK